MSQKSRWIEFQTSTPGVSYQSTILAAHMRYNQDTGAIIKHVTSHPFFGNASNKVFLLVNGGQGTFTGTLFLVYLGPGEWRVKVQLAEHCSLCT